MIVMEGCSKSCGHIPGSAFTKGRLRCGIGGERTDFCDVLERVGQRVEGPEVRVWKGSGLPTREQDIRILGTPLVHADFIATQLQERLQEHQLPLDRTSEVPDLQPAWALLLQCASSRANHFLRVVRPDLVRGFAAGHDEGLWRCLCRMLGVDFENEHSHEVATMPLSLVFGFRGARPGLVRLPLNDQGEAPRGGREDLGRIAEF